MVGTDNKVYSIEYERDGYLYSMHILGTKEEAEFHADSLGLGEPEEVNAIIPDLVKGMH
jgi:hypothetical protein